MSELIKFRVRLTTLLIRITTLLIRLTTLLVRITTLLIRLTTLLIRLRFHEGTVVNWTLPSLHGLEGHSIKGVYTVRIRVAYLTPVLVFAMPGVASFEPGAEPKFDLFADAVRTKLLVRGVTKGFFVTSLDRPIPFDRVGVLDRVEPLDRVGVLDLVDSLDRFGPLDLVGVLARAITALFIDLEFSILCLNPPPFFTCSLTANSSFMEPLSLKPMGLFLELGGQSLDTCGAPTLSNFEPRRKFSFSSPTEFRYFFTGIPDPFSPPAGGSGCSRPAPLDSVHPTLVGGVVEAFLILEEERMYSGFGPGTGLIFNPKIKHLLKIKKFSRIDKRLSI